MGCESKEDIKELDRLKQKLEKDPDNVNLLFKIGMLLFDPFIDTEAALPYFKKAMKLDPQNPDFPFWTGYFLYHNECDYEKSKELFEHALKLDPNRVEFNSMMFNALWEVTNDEKIGLKYLLKAIDLQPDWLNPRIQYINYLTNQKEFHKAERELEALRISIENRCRNKKLGPINALEKFYFGDTGTFDCVEAKEGLDYRRKNLEQKKLEK